MSKVFIGPELHKSRWANLCRGFTANLRTYALPYIVTFTFMSLIAASQYLTASKHSYFHYWDTLLTPMELRWLIPTALGFPLGFFGLWFAHHRHMQTSKQLDLQIRSQTQQRFFDAIKLLESEKAAIQIGALETIEQMARNNEIEFADECVTLLLHFLKQESPNFTWANPLYSIAAEREPSITDDERLLKPTTHKAFLTLAAVVPRYLEKIRKNPHAIDVRQTGVAGINLVKFGTPYASNSAQGEIRTKIEGMRFHDCIMKGASFRYCIFDNVIFGSRGSTDPRGGTDLTKADFSFAKFENTHFSFSNISDVNFAGIEGLDKELALSGCYFDYDKPPKNLPPGFELRHPRFRFVDDEEPDAPKILQELHASCIRSFCEEHEGFAPHGADRIITVSVEKPGNEITPPSHANV